MKEIGVLMKPDMALAAREDRKTQTRRIIEPQPGENQTLYYDPEANAVGYTEDDDIYVWHKCPYGKPGDIIWIREVHYRYGWWSPNGISKKTGRPKFKFHAGSDKTMFPEDPPANVLPNNDRGPGWYKRNSLFMPRSCARTLLEVTDIRVERLQYINNKDAQAEGPPYAYPHRHGNEGLLIQWPEGCGGDEIDQYGERHNTGYNDCWVCAFKQLWMGINGVRSWYENPWVWVIEFKRL